MWLFDRLGVGLKLALLAGVPVLGALVLSGLIARDAQQRAATAASLGSIEDLAQLTACMTDVVYALQTERAYIAYHAGTGKTQGTGLGGAQSETESARSALARFLDLRDESKLPTKLRDNLRVARTELARLETTRAKVNARDFSIDETIASIARIDDALIGATASLTQLSDDGKLLLNISRLVAAMQVIERTSREHALLAYVFGKTEFPPGSYRYFVTLSTEQDVYLEALRTSTSVDEYRRFEEIMRGAEAAKTDAMRKAAANTTDEALSVSPQEWFETQKATLARLRSMQRGMAEDVRASASTKVAETRLAVRLGIGLATGVLLISILIGTAIGRNLLRSVRVLSEAAKTVQREKDYSVRAQKTSSDELGVLTDAFNSMLADIQERDRELSVHRKNLEALVDARTRELSARNEQMRLVLDNVEQGLAMVDRDANLLPECSRAFMADFGAPLPGIPFGRILTADEQMQQYLTLAFDQLIADILPLELVLDQMPKTIKRNDRQFAISFIVLNRDGTPDGALLVTTDITAEVAARQAEMVQREQIRTFERVMRDRFGFTEFFAESRSLLERIRDDRFSGGVEKLRAIHTLKGNTAVFDVTSVSDAAHELEDALLEEDNQKTALAMAALLLSWDEFAKRIVPILGEDLGERVEVTRKELTDVLLLVRTRQDWAAVERSLVRLEREPARLRLERISEQLIGLARRLRRPIPNVEIDAYDVRMPMGKFREFWSSCAHLVRNIVDHGLETEAERMSNDKSPVNTVWLRAFSDDSSLTIEISDDGRGIDWKRLAERAAAKNLPTGTRADLVEALLSDGISTASAVTNSSGRGVGMSAVRAACAAAGGCIVVTSEAGRGTQFRFQFPTLENGHAEAPPRLSTAPVSLPPDAA